MSRSRITIDGEAANQLLRRVDGVRSDFEGTEDRADAAAEAVGAEGLASALRAFANNWRIRREAVGDDLDALSTRIRTTLERFDEWDSAVGEALEEAEGPGSWPVGAGGGAAASGEATGAPSNNAGEPAPVPPPATRPLGGAAAPADGGAASPADLPPERPGGPTEGANPVVAPDEANNVADVPVQDGAAVGESSGENPVDPVLPAEPAAPSPGEPQHDGWPLSVAETPEGLPPEQPGGHPEGAGEGALDVGPPSAGGAPDVPLGTEGAGGDAGGQPNDGGGSASRDLGPVPAPDVPGLEGPGEPVDGAPAVADGPDSGPTGPAAGATAAAAGGVAAAGAMAAGGGAGVRPVGMASAAGGGAGGGQTSESARLRQARKVLEEMKRRNDGGDRNE